MLQRFRTELLCANFQEAVRGVGRLYFYRYTSERVAFIVNLETVEGAVQITYGYTTVTDEDFLKKHGEDNENIKLRFSAKIERETDERIVAGSIKSVYDAYCNCAKDEILSLKKERQKQFLQKITDKLKPLRFKKKGAKWIRDLEGDFCLEFEAQKSQWSDEYYFNVSVYNKGIPFPSCYYSRLNVHGKSIYNWQLLTDEEVNGLLDEAIQNTLTPIIHTPLAELGEKQEIWKGCFCSRTTCNPCWVRKNG